jgi:hypothetical protein
MAYKPLLKYEPLRSIDSSTLSGSYQAVGTPLANSSSILKMVNNSTVLVTVSIDGTNDHDVLPSGSFFLYDVTSDSVDGVPGVFVQSGTQYYVKGSAGTGSIYLVTQYIPVI